MADRPRPSLSFDLAGRSGRARTCDPRFWRPVLYQLSYTPTDPRVATRIRAAFKHRGRLVCKGEARWLRLFVQRLLGHSPFPIIKNNRECP